MIIEINDDLFLEVKELIKDKNINLYKQLEKIKPLDSSLKNNSLQTARDTKTKRIKQSIKETIISLYSQDISPTKYKVNKITNIAYLTINKYYNEILEEVQNEH